ncbi:hypothetical protein BC936DRAFT_149046 [Jimgerdemannia flammicorona]|uniref:Uncharacterized protein n=1 Tax=Jimgerdemannia flammicorona TaxID=994334 RepID=A0A433D1P6_9FUNG|nr:hypothetical protein BC936DRAFT_149046 [Jimgerdemannia flammicorona]
MSKRTYEDDEEEIGPTVGPTLDDDDADIGPMLPSEVEAPKKKKRGTSSLELSGVFEPPPVLLGDRKEFVVTTSVDGHLKFWKKTDRGIEFVKHYRAHLGTFSE